MEDLNLLIILTGTVIVLIVVFDILLTVLHIDLDGPIAKSVFHITWKCHMMIIRKFPGIRRKIVAMAGPLMILFSIAIWVGLFISGFALIYWPYLDFFFMEEGHSPARFIHALYFSGTTATVLGYGDLVPLTGGLQILSFLQSGLGFALLTGIITFLINIVSGASERNALAMRLWVETGRSGRGINAIQRSIEYEEPGDLRLRLQSLLVSIHNIYQKMHQFPILDLYYRSKEPIYSPEFMIRSAAEMAVAAQILSAEEKYRRLRPVAQELDEVSVEIMSLIASQHIGKSVHNYLKNPEVQTTDKEELEKLRAMLTGSFPQLNLTGSSADSETVKLISRLRVFLIETNKLTGWRMDE